KRGSSTILPTVQTIRAQALEIFLTATTSSVSLMLQISTTPALYQRQQ
ncbi:hypothetical protein D030_4993B, partial [Vibrio parahaemolyticus AQ3810]